MLFMGCSITYGRGEGCVTATGMDTEMGKIAALLNRTETQASPLQKKLAQLSRILSLGVSGICLFIFVFSVFSAGDFSAAGILQAFMLAVSLAVAAIPEGLVVVVTLVLSLGMASMSKRRAIVRRLSAVETLGAAAVICCDKTGTLTQNRMAVSQTQGPVAALAAAFAHCNDAAWEEDGRWLGDPTETALAAYARQYISRPQPRLDELPFSSERKRMSTLHRQKDGSYIQYTKGAPEILLALCSSYMDEQGRVHPLQEAVKERFRQAQQDMAGQALRVLAAARKIYPASSRQPAIVEEGLTFLGLAGLMDPPRPEVLPAVQAARRAGVITVMVSGDSLATAEAVGKTLGILPEGGQGLEGGDLSELSDGQLAKDIEKRRLYARVKPEDKLRVVRAWQKKGYVTAMTGDGINDAPALKAADIGCAMGRNGSQVSKKAADLVLADDNFATIVSAIEEGRRIYENIRKAIQFLLSANLAEVLAIFIATLLSVKLFLPIHLLWINLITDCFPAIALGLEKAEADSMLRPPRRPEQSIFAGGLAWDILWQGLLLSALPICAYFSGGGGQTGMTMAFLTLISAEIFHALNLRSREKSLLQLKSANFPLFWAMGGAFAANLLLLSWPAGRQLFKLAALSPGLTLLSLALGALVIPAVECGKAVKRLAHKKAFSEP
ncbi:MAG: cation-translocating P-type ATPase [Firmicutes bacterium]|nr:cation-translocating P-type ATPase [Bacillota bacterium]